MLKKFLLIILLVSIIAFAGYIIVKAYPDFKAPLLNQAKPVEVALEFWGLWDNSDAWQPIIDDFQNNNILISGHPVKVTINYTKKNYQTFEKDLLDAKKNNTLPDIFTINGSWIEKYFSDLAPLDQNKAYAKEYELETFENIANSFPRETLNVWIHGGEIYGIPTYSDSLALYYNTELFEKAGIKNPPKTWKEFKEDVKKLTSIKNGILAKSGAAIGTGNNINRSSDILALLMMQGGAKVINEEKDIDINKEIDVLTTEGIEKRNPGMRAVVFYSEFSDPTKEIYTWDAFLPNSVDAFARGKTAMIFGYSYQTANILSISPDLKYAISPMPQLDDSDPKNFVNFTNTWTPVVAKKSGCRIIPLEASKEIDCEKIAWSFLSFATQKNSSKKYLDATGKPAARKDLIGEQANSNAKTGVFASQAETAISYSKFNDRIDAILSDMMDMINSDRKNMANTVNEAVQKIENLKIKDKNDRLK